MTDDGEVFQFSDGMRLIGSRASGRTIELGGDG